MDTQKEVTEAYEDMFSPDETIIQSEKQEPEISGDVLKRYDKFVHDAKTLAYAFEDLQNEKPFTALYKKADSLMNSIQKNKKAMIKIMDAARIRDW